jgi:hypothetical protein
MSRPCLSDLTHIQFGISIWNPQPHSAFSVGPSVRLLRSHSQLAFSRLAFSFGSRLLSAIPYDAAGQPVLHSCILRTSRLRRNHCAYCASRPDSARILSVLRTQHSWYPGFWSLARVMDFQTFVTFTCIRIRVFKRDILSTAQHPGNLLRYPPYPCTSSKTSSLLLVRLLCGRTPKSDFGLGQGCSARAEAKSAPDSALTASAVSHPGLLVGLLVL